MGSASLRTRARSYSVVSFAGFMSLLPLLGALLPWAASPADALFRIVFAVSLLSIEMQFVTLSGVGSLQTTALVNAMVSVAAAGWQLGRRPDVSWVSSIFRVAPWPAMLSLAAVVLVLNLAMPLEFADPYNQQRVEQIERLGTLEYSPDADPKVNIVGFLYELILADIRLLPAIGPTLVRLHGVLGMLFYLLGLAAVRDWLKAENARRWPWAALLVIPVVFHALVLVKNDLFFAVPASMALVWLITRAAEGTWRETASTAWLIGMVATFKPTNLPLALILVGGVLAVQRTHPCRSLAALALGGIGGELAGRLFFLF